jgi:hypothetical protein
MVVTIRVCKVSRRAGIFFFSAIQCGSFDLHLNIKFGPNEKLTSTEEGAIVYYVLPLFKIQGQVKNLLLCGQPIVSR